jgi:hypothetical protein
MHFMGRTITKASLGAGTLDILFATILSIVRDRAPADMLRFVPRVRSRKRPSGASPAPG